MHHTIPLLWKKNHATEKEGLFEGYASTACVDLDQEVIIPNAFKHTIVDWHQTPERMPYILHEHQLGKVVGICQELTIDEKGLYVKGKLLLDIPLGKHTYEQVKKGVMCGLSVGFVPKKSYMKEGRRYITEVDLKEISIVTLPCNEEAIIHAIKHDTRVESALNYTTKVVLKAIRDNQ